MRDHTLVHLVFFPGYLVVMTTCAMHMAVGDLLVGGIANFDHFHVEIQGYTRQRMVSIDRDGFQSDIGDGNYAALVGGETHAGLHILVAESGSGYFLDEVLIFLAISLVRIDLYVELFTLRLSFETLFHSRNKVPGSVEI